MVGCGAQTTLSGRLSVKGRVGGSDAVGGRVLWNVSVSRREMLTVLVTRRGYLGVSVGGDRRRGVSISRGVAVPWMVGRGARLSKRALVAQGFAWGALGIWGFKAWCMLVVRTINSRMVLVP